jgi:hypothetical protein
VCEARLQVGERGIGNGDSEAFDFHGRRGGRIG